MSKASFFITMSFLCSYALCDRPACPRPIDAYYVVLEGLAVVVLRQICQKRMAGRIPVVTIAKGI